MAKIPVSEMYVYLQQMLNEKWGYIYGTAGKLWTEKLQSSTTNEMAIKYGSKWIGHMVTDCSGVMVYIWKQFGLTIEHGSNAIARKRVGAMVKKPKPGYAAFKWREKGEPASYQDGKGDYYHIGIVGADGETVYESKGTATGFVTSAASTWTYFAPFKDVEYKETNEVMPMEPYYVEVTGDNVRIRTGPGVNYSKIGAAYKGDILRVITDNGNWVYVVPIETAPRNVEKSNLSAGYIYKQYTEEIAYFENEDVAFEVNQEDINEFVTITLSRSLAETLRKLLDAAL